MVGVGGREGRGALFGITFPVIIVLRRAAAQ